MSIDVTGKLIVQNSQHFPYVPPKFRPRCWWCNHLKDDLQERDHHQDGKQVKKCIKQIEHKIQNCIDSESTHVFQYPQITFHKPHKFTKSTSGYKRLAETP